MKEEFRDKQRVICIRAGNDHCEHDYVGKIQRVLAMNSRLFLGSDEMVHYKKNFTDYYKRKEDNK